MNKNELSSSRVVTLATKVWKLVTLWCVVLAEVVMECVATEDAKRCYIVIEMPIVFTGEEARSCMEYSHLFASLAR